jgi:hypothetical protein
LQRHFNLSLLDDKALNFEFLTFSAQ